MRRSILFKTVFSVNISVLLLSQHLACIALTLQTTEKWRWANLYRVVSIRAWPGESQVSNEKNVQYSRLDLDIFIISYKIFFYSIIIEQWTNFIVKPTTIKRFDETIIIWGESRRLFYTHRSGQERCGVVSNARQLRRVLAGRLILLWNVFKLN